MSKRRFALEASEVADKTCPAVGCNRQAEPHWRATLRVYPSGMLQTAPAHREFIACSSHAFPIAQGLIADILSEGAMRESAGLAPGRPGKD